MTKLDDEEVSELRETIGKLMRLLKVAEGMASQNYSLKFSAAETEAMLFLRANSGCASKDVADYLGVVPTTWSTILNRLVERGLIERIRPEANRRLVELSLSKDGQATVESILHQQNAHARAMLLALNDTERRPFLDAMKKIAASLS